MTADEEIANLKKKVATLEENVKQLQQQLNEMPGTVARNIRKSAGRRLP